MGFLRFLSIGLIVAATVISSPTSGLSTVPAGLLPSPRAALAAVYDHNESVYLLGGLGQEPINDILRYNIRTESIEYLSSFRSEGLYSGAAHMDVRGNIYYVGGIKIDLGFGDFVPDIWMLNGSDPTPTKVAELPDPLGSHCTIYDGGSGVYTMGGADLFSYQHQIFYYNSELDEVVSMVPPEPVQRVGSPCVGYGDSSYMFGGLNNFQTPNYLSTILKSNPGTGIVETLNVTLPFPAYQSAAVLVGDGVYLVGGATGSVGTSNYLNRFDLGTWEIEQLQPTGFKAELMETGSVYVPSLNRIYVFGGYKPISGYQDDIFYIQLDE